MKKLLLVLLLATAGFFTSCSDDCTQDALSTKMTSGYSKSSGKVTVCHVLPNGNTQTISINQDDLQFHLDHGDSEGECPTLSDGGLHFSDGNIVEIDCSYELPFIHVNDNGEQWLFESPK